MKKKLLLLSVVAAVMCLSSSIALALDPMGSPTAGLQKGQFSAGVEYSHSDMDLKFHRGWYSTSGTLDSFTAEDIRMNKVYVNLGYGMMNNWEVFLRLGGADATFKNQNDDKYNCDSDSAIGFGTKVTLYEADKIKWGALFQMSWASSDGRTYVNYASYPSNNMYSDKVEIKTMEVQIAAGPDYQLTDKVRIYGGPFLHLIDGEVNGEWHGLTAPNAYVGDEYYDIDTVSTFGGYIGTQINIAKNLYYSIEYQHTGAADALGMSMTWRF